MLGQPTGLPGQKRMLLVYALVFVLAIGVHQLFDPLTTWFRHQEAAEMIEDGILCVITIAIVMTLLRQSEHRLAAVEEEHRQRFASFEAVVSGIDSRILSNEPLDEILRFVCARLRTLYGLESVEIELQHDETRPSRVTGGIRVPIVAGERTLGDLIIRSDGNPPHSTLHELRGFAEQVALSLVAAGAHEQIRLQTVALESAANAILITDINGVICWVNQAFTDLTGWAADDVLGHTPRLLRSGNHSPTFYRQMWTTLLGGHVWRGEMYNRRRDGTIYPEEQTITPVRGKDGAITHFVAIKQDISERKDQEEQIRYLAMNDALTSLPNRRAFDNIVQRVIRETADGGVQAAMVIVDVDDFKLVNDSAGHTIGDQVLAELAQLLQRQLRAGDFLGRLGGDEFVIVLQNVTEEGAFEIAERLRAAVDASRFYEPDVVIDVTVSAGIAMIERGLDARTLLSRADSAMYTAKERGKNRVIAWHADQEVAHGLAEAGRWISRIKAALRDNRFALAFQPIVRLGSGETVHFEALIRMIDDNGEHVQPGAFLPIAERYGLMPAIDRWVIEAVLDMLAIFPEVRIFANLSAASIGDDALLSHIEQRIRASGIVPGRLAFEITESAAVTDFVSARNWIRRMKELGCLFALDDFGSGFSSFAYLRALSVDYVKIDRSFIGDLDTNPTTRALVQAVNTVAHTLGKEVIAEGVETAVHAELLHQLGIEHGQGFHWGEPQCDIFAAATIP